MTVCGRVVWVWDAETGTLVRKYDESALEDPARASILERSRYNIPPTAPLPIVFEDEGATRVDVARWGLPNPSRPGVVFNTRMERAAGSPMWRPLLGRSHCVVPVTGFYEWQKAGGRTVPYFIRRSDGHVMGLAGLYAWREVDGASRLCVSIATCAPSRQMAPVHDRMPVILAADSWAAWMAGPSPEEAVDMARPAEDVLELVRVSPAVGSTENDDASLIRPAAQQRL